MKPLEPRSLNANGRGKVVPPEYVNSPRQKIIDVDQGGMVNSDVSPEGRMDATPETTMTSTGVSVAPDNGKSAVQKLAKKRSVKAFLAAAGIGAIAAGAFGYQWWQYASSHEETDNATVAGHVHQISTRVPGTVQSVLVNDNQNVKQGQVLVQLDPTDFQLKLQQAQAELAAAQQKANTAEINVAASAKTAEASGTQSQGDIARANAAIAQARAQLSEAQAGVPRAQAQLAQSQANLQQAQADLERYTALFNQGAIPQRQLDTARQAYRVALAQTNADQEQVRQAQARVAQAQQSVSTAVAGLSSAQSSVQQAQARGIQTEVSQSDLGTARAAIAQAQVNLKNAQQQLAYTRITAPASGKVGRKTVEVGQQVQPGTPLMAIVGDEYWVTANFKETQLEYMRPGQEAEIKIDSLPHQTFRGRVESLSPASGAEFALLPPDNATGNFTKVVQRIPVKVVFDRDSVRGFESFITPGMSATVTVTVK